MKRTPAIDRFKAKIAYAPTGCWLWTGYVDRAGYARFHTKDEQRAHRWSYTHFVGPIPDGLVIDHTCRVRHCVNPEHLRVVTSRDNSHAPGSQAPAKLLREATTCKHGHPWNEENTAWNSKGYRYCQACHRERGARTRAALAAMQGEQCPKGHERQRTSDGKRYCPTCASEARAHLRKPPITTFGCGHERSQTGLLASTGYLYCGECRVTRRRR